MARGRENCGRQERTPAAPDKETAAKMDPITLVSCTAVQIYPRPGDSPPQDVTVTLTVGGSSGDGTVVIHSGGSTGPVVGSTPTGGVGSPVAVPGATSIWIHYMAKPGKPSTVDVTYVLNVV